MNLRDRIYGCLAGLALGDALGMPTEFLRPSEIKKEFGWVDHFVRAPSWHPHHILSPGQITDDTGQTLAIAHAYQADGRLTVEDVARQLLAWADDTGDALPVILGPSTRQALDRLRKGEDPRSTGQQGTTNGAAFRALVVGLVNYERPAQLVEQMIEACLPTHGTTVAISGAVAVAYAVAAACTEGATLEDIFLAARRGAEEGRKHGTWVWGIPLDMRIELALRMVAENPVPDGALAALFNYVGVDMLVAESVPTAFGVIALANGDPMKAVIYGANIGGDTDTIATIAGGICGAWRGIDAIDHKLLSQVEKANHLDLATEAEKLEEVIQSRC